MTRALVIGGAGFIGVAACKELMRRGVETVAGGRTPRPYGTFTSYHAFDRRDAGQLAGALEHVRPDVVLDLARPAPADIEDLVRIFDGRYVVVAQEPPATAGVVIRAHAVIGPDDPSLRIARCIRLVERGEPIPVPEATYERNAGLAWVKDVGYACALACDPARRLDGSSFDVAFAGVSLRDLFEAIGRALGRPVELRPLPDAEAPYPPAPPLDLQPSQAQLGFRPSSLEDALPETLAWYLARARSLA
ncbi:MAG TPA: NAD-dependent epimerase/dehydratase family protein [Candidatus Dormibacteraeota bacterium]